MRRFAVCLALILSSCGTPKPVSAQSVIDTIKAAGISVTNVAPDPPVSDSIAPHSYTEQLGFQLPDLAPAGKGGQVMVCDTKKNCDAMVAYFGAMVALAGPYVYQSPDGRVVVQLNSGMTPQNAAKIEAIVKTLP
jgi:hypothetical protein